MKLIDTGRSEYGWSTIGDILLCPQKFSFVQADRGLGIDANSPATDRGTIVHTFSAHHYITKVKGENPDDYMTPDLAMEACDEGQRTLRTNPDLFVYLKNLMHGYLDVYREADEQFEVLAVEKQFAANFLDKDNGKIRKLTYKADRVIRFYTNGKVYFVDTKTTSGTLKPLAEWYSLSGQMFLGELIGRGTYKEEWGGILLNGIRANPKIVTNQYERFPMELGPAALAGFKPSVLHAFNLRDQLEGTPLNQYPRAMNPHVCKNKYGICDQYQRCHHG